MNTITIKYSLFSLMILALLFVGDLYATRVSGEVSGDWTVDGNPYDVMGDIVLRAGQTLNIEAGVQVRFISNSKFDVFGTLLANGELGDSITFRANNGQIGDYRWIKFEGGGANESILNYCIITHTDRGVHFLRSAATINNSRISHHVATCIRLEGSTGSVMNSSISNSQNTGMIIEERSEPTVRGCSIFQHPDNGISIRDNSGGIISGNSIFGVNDNGISLNTAGVCSLAYNMISGCGLRGIYVNQSNQARIFRNIILTCRGDYAIYVYRSESCDVINNTITSNSGTGLAVINSTANTFSNVIILNQRNGILVQSANPNLSSNCIWNNGGNDYSGIEPANSDISEDPRLDQEYVPAEGSPVIDRGDQRYRDPDDTRADMGARFFNQNFAPVIEISWPEDPDIIEGDIEQEFGVEAADPDNHQLSYTWYINGETAGEGTKFFHTFTRDAEYQVIVIVDDGFYMGQTSVEWNFTVQGAGVRNWYEGALINFRLGSPYPNPFNGSSQFSLFLQTAGIANISLVDLGGRTLEILYRGTIKRGQHIFTINSSNIPAGTFIVRAEINGRRELKKMVVLK